MAVGKGVASAVEMIMKKWGDDIVGATGDLVQKMDFPEEVATRIAKGDLPMDDASRAARASDQGYGDTLYRGYSPALPPSSNSDLWASTSKDVAQTYADSLNGGLLTEIRTNASNLADVNAGKKGFDRVQTNSNKLKGLQGNPQTMGVFNGTDEISEAVKNSGNYDGTKFRNIRDEMGDINGPTKKVSEYEIADTYNILGSRPDVSIRGADAAFDPQYKGSSMMGEATVPLLGGTAAVTAGALAAPALMKDGVFQHSATKEPVVERREPVNNQSSLLEGVTDFADNVFTNFKNAAGPVGSLLMPFEGINDYLKVVNDNDKQPTWMDRLGLLDI